MVNKARGRFKYSKCIHLSNLLISPQILMQKPDPQHPKNDPISAYSYKHEVKQI